jgi:hypothetical protein
MAAIPFHPFYNGTAIKLIVSIAGAPFAWGF